ncbi:unnamed protein product [Moneuplotes crassus]|uniref:Uncharacterized protein n=1 Tax=Euplotes crassus TaxID=5936 RepID=A0AAD1YB02_EUPCR|nr:unnamed protein product [Moneuplotes crassus]
MELDPTDQFNLREKIQRLTVAEFDQIIDEAKARVDMEERKEDQKIAKLEHLRLTLVLFNEKATDQNIEEFEDLYQKLIGPDPENEDEAIPLKYKAEFMFNLFDIFRYNGGYTRCRVLMGLFKELFETHKADDYVAFKYYSAYLCVDSNYMTLACKTPEEYIGNIFEDIHSREFPQEILRDLEFKKDMLFCNYYSLADTEKWMVATDKLLETCESTRLLHLMKDFVIGNYQNFAKDDEKMNKQVRRALPMMKEELKTHLEPELADCFLGLSMIEIMDYMDKKNKKDKKDKEGVARRVDVLIKLTEHHKLTKTSKLFFKIMATLVMFSLDPESVDQGKVFGFRKEFEELVSRSTYEMNYSMMDGFGLLVNIQELMGAKIDYQIAKNYADLIKDDKLSYISFVSSLESIRDPTMKPYIETALEYCEEFGVDKLHKFRANLDLANIMVMMVVPDMQGIMKAMTELDSLAELYEQNLNIFLETKLQSIYSTQLMMANSTGNVQKYIQVGLKFLPKQSVVNEFATDTYETIISQIAVQGDIAKADKLCNDFLAYARKNGENTKPYHKAIVLKMSMLSENYNLSQALQASAKCEQISLAVYGEGSLEHANAIRASCQMKINIGKLQESYQGLLNCYEMYKSNYGSETNPASSRVLTSLAMIKKYLKEFEDAYNLVDKAKEIEQKMTSKFSQQYTLILKIEKSIEDAEQKHHERHKLLFGKSKKYSKAKVAVALIGFGLATFGAMYYFRNKRSK